MPEKLRELFKYLGPAFVVSVAYMDPGNFATNITGGSRFNYNLLWVILWSNLMAIFLQSLSAKLGIATGLDLPTNCSKVFSRRVNWWLWSVAGLASIATYLAEFLGATLGFYILFHIPLIWAALATIIISFAIPLLEKFGHQHVERIIGMFIAIMGIAYILEVFLAKPNWGEIAVHTLIPTLGKDSIFVAVGMLGATVMPHVIYLHSQLVQPRRQTNDPASLKRHYRLERLDIIIAMNLAFLINAAMVIVAASVFFSAGTAVDSIEQAHQSLTPLLGTLSSGAFGLALLASGLSSSTVGTMAGQVILKGFVGLDIPVYLRKLITIIPAFIILLLGINPMQILLLSQVTLSFALPAAIIPLLILTSRKAVMGEFANSRLTNITGSIIAGIIIALNLVLVFLATTG
ncbi:MAG TPA: Nramp family divalent metal transporter [Verrucomicrobiae bacterium]|nr:Nramp family divalent metal transporter [Verrucomicrobiae bacterium]